jgi:hypothetical protein
MKRNPKILGQVVDVEGSLWDVRQIRDTKHGFDLLFGSPAAPGVYRGGLPRLIATRPLTDFWEAHQTKLGVLFDLPAGRTTLKRVRHHLGFNYLQDRAEFWQDRIEDLASLKTREFARVHEVPVYVVKRARRKLLGALARPVGWWRKPEFLEILRSSVPLRVMGEKLGISTSQAHRLKHRACFENETRDINLGTDCYGAPFTADSAGEKIAGGTGRFTAPPTPPAP